MEILCVDSAQLEENLDAVFARFNTSILTLLSEDK